MSVESIPLGELCDILSGYAWSASKFNHDKRGVPIIRIQNVDTSSGNDFVYWNEPYDNRFLIHQGDILLSLSGSFRIESWNGPVALLNQRIIKLTPFSKLDRGWLLHVLRPRLGQIERLGKHALVNNVSLSDIKNLSVPLPPLAEQKRIADILDRAEALRASRRAALALLDTLPQAIFIEMFGDPVTNPKGWPIAQFGSLIKSGPQNGFYKPATEYGSGTPIIRIDGFYDGVVTGLAKLKRVNTDEAERALYSLATGDILVNRVISPEYLGKCALIPELSEVTIFESNMMRLRVDTIRLDPRFTVEMLQSKRIAAQILQSAKHAVNQSSINQQDVRGFHFPLPPLPLQQEFAHRVAAVEALRSTHRASLAALDELFASLQHRAFRGEL